MAEPYLGMGKTGNQTSAASLAALRSLALRSNRPTTGRAAHSPAGRQVTTGTNARGNQSSWRRCFGKLSAP